MSTLETYLSLPGTSSMTMDVEGVSLIAVFSFDDDGIHEIVFFDDTQVDWPWEYVTFEEVEDWIENEAKFQREEAELERELNKRG